MALEDKELLIVPLSEEDQDIKRKSASVQPSSIDLRIGRILIPDEETDKENTQVASMWRIKAGHSVVIETRETVTLSSKISGFGFPPASLAAKGLLVTNPGHVDPGYSGTLRLTLINMGRSEFPLREGLPIISLLLFRFGDATEYPVQSNYSQRRSSDEVKPRDDGEAVKGPISRFWELF